MWTKGNGGESDFLVYSYVILIVCLKGDSVNDGCCRWSSLLVCLSGLFEIIKIKNVVQYNKLSLGTTLKLSLSQNWGNLKARIKPFDSLYGAANVEGVK